MCHDGSHPLSQQNEQISSHIQRHAPESRLPCTTETKNQCFVQGQASSDLNEKDCKVHIDFDKQLSELERAIFTRAEKSSDLRTKHNFLNACVQARWNPPSITDMVLQNLEKQKRIQGLREDISEVKERIHTYYKIPFLADEAHGNEDKAKSLEDEISKMRQRLLQNRQEPNSASQGSSLQELLLAARYGWDMETAAGLEAILKNNPKRPACLEVLVERSLNERLVCLDHQRTELSVLQSGYATASRYRDQSTSGAPSMPSKSTKRVGIQKPMHIREGVDVDNDVLVAFTITKY